MQAPTPTQAFRDVSELVRLIDDFETCALPTDRWNHRAHLAVAAWYLAHFGESEATERMIAAIRRYNRRHGILVTPGGGYHETLTLFWLAMGCYFLQNYPARCILTKVNGFVRKYGNRKRLHLEYYSAERIQSAKARNCWVPPDRKPLPCGPTRAACRVSGNAN